MQHKPGLILRRIRRGQTSWSRQCTTLHLTVCSFTGSLHWNIKYVNRWVSTSDPWGHNSYPCCICMLPLWLPDAVTKWPMNIRGLYLSGLAHFNLVWLRLDSLSSFYQFVVESLTCRKEREKRCAAFVWFNTVLLFGFSTCWVLNTIFLDFDATCVYM